MADFYVDFSATNDGDGTAYTQAGSPGGVGAYNTISGKTFTGGDKVWFRRVTRGSDYSGDITFGVAGVIYIGWPVSGDDYYSTRPSGAQATWDADGGTYAKFSINGAANELNINASTIEMHRLHVLQTATNSDVMALAASISNCVFKSCLFENNQTTNTSSLITVGASNTGHTFNTVEFKLNTFSPSTSTGLISQTQAFTYKNCTVTITTLSPTSSTSSIFTISGGTMHDTTINITTLSGTVGTQYLVMTTSAAHVVNFTVTVTTYSASASQPALQVSSTGSTVKNFKSNSGKSIIITGKGSDIEINSFTQTHLDASGGVQISADGLRITVNNATFLTGNTAGDIVFTTNSYGSVCFARNCTYQTSPEVVFNPSTDIGARAFSFDHNGTANAWKYFHKDGTLLASSVVRTGGESYSIKMENTNSGSLNRGAIQASIKGSETIWLSLSSGARTITIYGAYKTYTTLLADNIWINSEYLNGSNVLTYPSSYAFNTALTSDSSTWTGDSGLTKFKMVLSFTLPSDQIVPLRIFGTKYEAGAYLYIDPKPEVT